MKCEDSVSRCELEAVYLWTWHHHGVDPSPGPNGSYLHEHVVEIALCTQHCAEWRHYIDRARRGQLTPGEGSPAWWTPYSVRTL